MSIISKVKKHSPQEFLYFSYINKVYVSKASNLSLPETTAFLLLTWKSCNQRRQNFYIRRCISLVSSIFRPSSLWSKWHLKYKKYHFYTSNKIKNSYASEWQLICNFHTFNHQNHPKDGRYNAPKLDCCWRLEQLSNFPCN